MPNRLLAFAIAAMAVMTASAGLAQDQPESDFATAKAHHLARLQQELACVQAAASFDAMHKCSPPPPGDHRGPPPGASR